MSISEIAALTEILPIGFDDLDGIVEIEQSAHSHPWSRATLMNSFGKLACNGLAQYQQQLAGFFITRVVAGDAELLNICVDPAFQGHGVGQLLLSTMKLWVAEKNAEQIWLEVRESNRVAQQLYYNNGFDVVDRRKDYYPGQSGREDALIMACYL